MPITYRVDREHKMVVAKAQGILTDEDLRAYAGTVLTDSDVRRGFDSLVDFGDVTNVQVSTSGVGDIIDVIRDSEQPVRETKSAVVASRRNAQELSRLIDLLRGSVPPAMRLFRDMAAARAWLGLADDDPQTAQERRAAPRKQVHFLVLCRSGIKQGSARLVNISLTGARLESTSIHPAAGAIVKVRLDSLELDAPIELKGKVVRHTGTGFAIQFLEVTPGILDRMGVPS